MASSDSALLYTILSPVGGYFKSGTNGAVSLLADPRYTRAWPGLYLFLLMLISLLQS